VRRLHRFHQALEDGAGIRTALQREREKVAKSRTALQAFEGIEPVAAKEALTKVAEMADWDPEKKLAEAKTQYEQQLQAQYEGQLKQATDKHGKEAAAAKLRNEVLEGQLASTLVDAAATKAIVEAKGSIALLLPTVKAKVGRKLGDDGKMTVFVADETGIPRLSPKAGSTEQMTIEELVAELRQSEQYARAFDGTGASGGGAGGGVLRPLASVKVTSVADEAKITPVSKKTCVKPGHLIISIHRPDSNPITEMEIIVTNEKGNARLVYLPQVEMLYSKLHRLGISSSS